MDWWFHRGPVKANQRPQSEGQANRVKKILHEHIEQDAKQELSSQFVERAGSGLQASFQQQGAALAECTRAGASISISLSFSVARGSLSLPPSRSATGRSALKFKTGPR